MNPAEQKQFDDAFVAAQGDGKQIAIAMYELGKRVATPAVLPAGWKYIAVHAAAFDDLTYALSRSQENDHLPGDVGNAWEVFEFDVNAVPTASPAPAAVPESQPAGQTKNKDMEYLMENKQLKSHEFETPEFHEIIAAVMNASSGSENEHANASFALSEYIQELRLRAYTLGRQSAIRDYAETINQIRASSAQAPESQPAVVAQWIRDHYQDHPNVDSLCTALMAAFATGAAPAAAPVAADAGWMPIATAPRDGTYVLLGSAESGGAWVGKYEEQYQSGWRPENPWSSMMLNVQHLPVKYPRLRPTHWMPLPPAPVSTDNQQEGQRRD